MLICLFIAFIGYNGGYGGAGLGLGHRYGNGGMKGPKPGMKISENCTTLNLFIIVFG